MEDGEAIGVGSVRHSCWLGASWRRQSIAAGSICRETHWAFGTEGTILGYPPLPLTLPSSRKPSPSPPAATAATAAAAYSSTYEPLR